MPRRREVPFDPTTRAPHGREVACSAAETDTQALMETRPFEDPQPSRASLLPMRDLIQDAIENVLTEREAWIFDACVVERKSIRALSVELSLAKSHIDRIKHRAVAKLRDALQHEQIIVDYLSRWDDEELELAA